MTVVSLVKRHGIKGMRGFCGCVEPVWAASSCIIKRFRSVFNFLPNLTVFRLMYALPLHKPRKTRVYRPLRSPLVETKKYFGGNTKAIAFPGLAWPGLTYNNVVDALLPRSSAITATVNNANSCVVAPELVCCLPTTTSTAAAEPHLRIRPPNLTDAISCCAVFVAM